MSLFADTLRALMGCIDYSREDWLEYLFIRVIGETDFRKKHLKRMDAWLADDALPRPHDLNMVWLLAKDRYAKESVAEREAFHRMALMRATEVSPLGNQMLPCVWVYMRRLAFDALTSRLAKLNQQERGALLEKIYPPETDLELLLKRHGITEEVLRGDAVFPKDWEDVPMGPH